MASLLLWEGWRRFHRGDDIWEQPCSRRKSSQSDKGVGQRIAYMEKRRRENRASTGRRKKGV
jgi:hypothetical protein